MEAIDFIKKNHKEYLKKINYDYIDAKGHNYNYYLNKYINENILIENKNVYFNTKYIKNIKNFKPKSIIMPKFYNDKIKILANLNYFKLIFNYKCDILKEIKSYTNKFIFNINYPLLKFISCRDVIFNTIQPIEEIKIYDPYKNSNILNNLDDLIDKLPQLKNIKIFYGSNYEYTCHCILNYNNNYWNLNISSHKKRYRHNVIPYTIKIPRFNNINNLNIIMNYYKAKFSNINNLIIDGINEEKYDKYNFEIELSNIKHIEILTQYNIILNDLYNVEYIKYPKKYENRKITILNFYKDEKNKIQTKNQSYLNILLQKINFINSLTIKIFFNLINFELLGFRKIEDDEYYIIERI